VDPFEFIMVLVSIIMGLGIANLLRGVIRSLRPDTRSAPSLVHSIWVAWVFVMHVAVWGGRWLMAERVVWTFGDLLGFLLVPILLFALSELAFPPERAQTDLQGYYYRIRGRFFGVAAALMLSMAWSSISLFGFAVLDGRTLSFASVAPVFVVLALVPHRRLHLATSILVALATLWLYSALTVRALPPAPPILLAQTNTFPATGGPIHITPFAGAGVQLEYQGIVIHVDPWSRGDYSDAKPANLILITDTPGDHLDPDLIRQLSTSGTLVIVPADPASARDEGGAQRLQQLDGAEVMNNDERRDLDFPREGAPDVTIESVAMYDLIPGAPFHARGEGNGYVVTLGGVRIYFSGVTECTPEVQAIRGLDIAFMPMNLPNGRMPPSAAAECVKALDPDVVYPYHYRELPIDDFVEALRGGPIEVRLHDWYPS
jgi:L-ascorbate metabolism protein UlaG (beta-lactamase superfamily)